MADFWTVNKIKKGFEKFRCAHDRLPKAIEIDTLNYLPSARYIQKRFGGLEHLRSELGYINTHFGKGKFRSDIAKEAGARSKEIEQNLHDQLHSFFPTDAIQRERNFCANYRVDFYINTDKGKFGIDIFYAKNMRALQSSINIKMKKYQHFPDTLYLTVSNKTITQQELDLYSSRKTIPLPENVSLITLPTLDTHLRKL